MGVGIKVGNGLEVGVGVGVEVGRRLGEASPRVRDSCESETGSERLGVVVGVGVDVSSPETSAWRTWGLLFIFALLNAV